MRQNFIVFCTCLCWPLVSEAFADFHGPRPLDPDLERPRANFSCMTADDCIFKDVRNCCGQYIQCANVNFVLETDYLERLEAWCLQLGVLGECGYPNLSGCKCNNNRCSKCPKLEAKWSPRRRRSCAKSLSARSGKSASAPKPQAFTAYFCGLTSVNLPVLDANLHKTRASH
eukprot:6213118-Pleurochrysis_carterae.AAC.2